MVAEKIKEVALNVIEQFGTYITVKKPSSSSYNPTSGKVETVSGTQSQIKVHIDNYEANEISNLVQQGDLKMIVNVDTVLSKDDVIAFDGSDWNIINVSPTYVENIKVIQEVQIRR